MGINRRRIAKIDASPNDDDYVSFLLACSILQMLVGNKVVERVWAHAAHRPGIVYGARKALEVLL